MYELRRVLLLRSKNERVKARVFSWAFGAARADDVEGLATKTNATLLWVPLVRGFLAFLPLLRLPLVTVACEEKYIYFILFKLKLVGKCRLI